MNHKIISQLFVAMFCSTLLIACNGNSSSNIDEEIDKANTNTGGGGQIIINGEAIEPDNNIEIEPDNVIE